MKTKYLICFILTFCSFASATESIVIKYKKVAYEFDLPKPFIYAKVEASLNSNSSKLTKIRVTGINFKFEIKERRLSKYKNINLNSLRIYEGISLEDRGEIESDASFEEYEIKEFIICIDYGDFKQGYRLNNKGWYRDVLGVVIDANGKFRVDTYLVENQNIPSSACTI